MKNLLTIFAFYFDHWIFQIPITDSRARSKGGNSFIKFHLFKKRSKHIVDAVRNALFLMITSCWCSKNMWFYDFQPLQNSVCRQGERVVLECTVSPFPPPERVQWFRNEIEIKPSNDYQITYRYKPTLFRLYEILTKYLTLRDRIGLELWRLRLKFMLAWALFSGMPYLQCILMDEILFQQWSVFTYHRWSFPRRHWEIHMHNHN